jgi:hypothetical protein
LVLPPVLGQLAGAEAEAEGAEAATGVDRGQLPVVADQHHLSAPSWNYMGVSSA